MTGLDAVLLVVHVLATGGRVAAGGLAELRPALLRVRSDLGATGAAVGVRRRR